MIKISQKQRGNPLLNYLSVNSWCYDNNISADYEINNSARVLFLSLKFHACKPEYIYTRMGSIKSGYLILLIDSPNFNLALRKLYETINNRLRILLCGSYEECAKYIKGFELATRSSFAGLRKRKAGHEAFLEAFPKIDKSNILAIKDNYETIQSLFLGVDELEKIPGFGSIKAESIKMYMNMPFK